VGQLYSHQTKAINAVRTGRDAVVATGTSSGKTLCYSVPVLERILERPAARALYLFPTKALAQDQLGGLADLQAHLGKTAFKFGAYDGDTPPHQRSRLRRSANIILTNPDMLHVGILPHHNLWSFLFRNLYAVVIDEAHIYRGVFGSQVAAVLRRFDRVCRFYGSRPIYICASATIANPGEHIERLIRRRPVVIDEDGAPAGQRYLVLWNPPFLDGAHSSRRSANAEATHLFVQLIMNELRTICFTKSRRVAELIRMYARRELMQSAPQQADLVASYRAGYLANDRRRIERDLFDGRLLGVASTNALELGIDVGSLDATIQVGFPGTVASFWQQAGRAGRRERPGLSILVGLSDALDQYFMAHPNELFGRSPEHALIDPHNPYILAQHLPCAAYELPIVQEDRALFGDEMEEIAAALERRGHLSRFAGRWTYPRHDYPAQKVSIRSAGSNNYVLLDTARHNAALEQLEESRALIQVYPGAVFFHQGETYVVSRLDVANRLAYARPEEVDYYTQARQISEVTIESPERTARHAGASVSFGRVRVVEHVIGFKRLQQYTETVLSDEPLDLPPVEFDTRAVWWDIPPEVEMAVRTGRLNFLGGIHALEHTCIALLPLFTMIDRWDLGGMSTPNHPQTGRPQVFIYDAYPGGIGITEKGYDLIETWWAATYARLQECACSDGCPSCVQSPKCGDNNQPLDKAAAMLMLGMLTRGDSAHAAGVSPTVARQSTQRASPTRPAARGEGHVSGGRHAPTGL
jgi:DEAD/DEAH box helicase domain-containing protein